MNNACCAQNEKVVQHFLRHFKLLEKFSETMNKKNSTPVGDALKKTRLGRLKYSRDWSDPTNIKVRKTFLDQMFSFRAIFLFFLGITR